MTSVEVRCPKCDSTYRVSGDLLGKSGRCKQCGQSFLLEIALDTVNSVQCDTDTSGESAGPQSTRLPKSIGRFEIEKQLGKGGFGTVYRARDPILERQVALKVPHPHLLHNVEDRQRYLREAKTAARLRHAHIVPLFEATISGDDLYIASAFIEGEPLDVVLRERRPGLVESVGWVIKLARALDYAHGQGIIHRDVKPSNIILDEHGEPLLMDFGLARIIASDEQLTQNDSVLGTPAYMSPEQAAGRIHEMTPATDQYSLGVVLYELLCGRRPFTGPIGLVISLVINTDPPPLREHDSQVPVELESICLRTMAKRIAERYGSLGEVAVELERYLENRRDSANASGRPASPTISTQSAVTPTSDAVLEVVVELPASDQACTKSKNSASFARSVDRGFRLPSWRPLQVVGGLDIRRWIQVAGIASLLVVVSVGITLAISVALSLSEKQQFAVDPSAIAPPIAPVEPAVTNPTSSPVVSPPLAEPAAVVTNDGTAGLAPVMQASIPAQAIPPASPNSVPKTMPELATAPFTESEAKSHQLAWSEYLDQPVELTNSIGMKLMLIPPGEFMMGSSDMEATRGPDEKEHSVTIASPFYIGTYEVTQGEYERMMEFQPSNFSLRIEGSEEITESTLQRFPVEQVSWDNAVEYCRRLSSLPAERAAGRVYRLPTEAEWEYACRAGTTTPFYFGTHLTGQQANINGNYPYGITTIGPYLDRPTAVGSYEANGFGLFDMHGNVWEWCSDLYVDYVTRMQEKPDGDESESLYVTRGGGWLNHAETCRSATRTRSRLDDRSINHGFRVALSSLIKQTDD